MPRNLSIALLCLAASGWLATAAAQTIYRCGDSYGQQPCAGGTPVQAGDARTAGSQRAQASAAARGDARAADALEKARLKEEAQPAQAYIPPAKPQDSEGGNHAAAGKVSKPTVFRAATPGTPAQAGAKKKAAKAKKAKKKAASGRRGADKA